MNKGSSLSLAEQFQFLRARLESLSEVSRSLLITSAHSGDGKAACAYGLALEFEVAGYPTLLVDLDYRDPALKAAVGLEDLSQITDRESIDRFLLTKPGSRSAMLSLTNTKLCMSASSGSVKLFLSTVLQRFEKVIILGPTLVDSGVGLLFSTECDGVITTTRKGRSVTAGDRALVETINNESITFLGVVSVSQSACLEPLAIASPRYSDAAGASSSHFRKADKSSSKLLL